MRDLFVFATLLYCYHYYGGDKLSLAMVRKKSILFRAGHIMTSAYVRSMSAAVWCVCVSASGAEVNPYGRLYGICHSYYVVWLLHSAVLLVRQSNTIKWIDGTRPYVSANECVQCPIQRTHELNEIHCYQNKWRMKKLCNLILQARPSQQLTGAGLFSDIFVYLDSSLIVTQKTIERS